MNIQYDSSKGNEKLPVVVTPAMIVTIRDHFHLHPLWRSGTEEFTLRKRSDGQNEKSPPHPPRLSHGCLLTPSFFNSAYNDWGPFSSPTALVIWNRRIHTVKKRSDDQNEKYPTHPPLYLLLPFDPILL
ncbi:hypothetical protein CEXT_379631 [Caerostris extrusa]|uniref:Uncharacterized protein n=1 Tax=Caerostris extrusa TaxID=172846 RepID=A0AAV4NTE1_CAEEX|nr:hypothetical protein CEXT_379631 [Caerostris extrusa]